MIDRRKRPLPALLALLVAVLCGGAALGEKPPAAAVSSYERSFWLHASLASTPRRGYWQAAAPWSDTPSDEHIRNAARLLTDKYSANRLYLVYHQEIPPADAQRMFLTWRRHCPPNVQLVPTLVLRMYDARQTPVFQSEELRRSVAFFQRSIDAERVAVYDVYPRRDQGDALTVLTSLYPKGLIRVGIQPDERLARPFVAAVQDTWSGFCHGKTNADWLDRGFGAETLRGWVAERNRDRLPVAWDLIVVAWDYKATDRGGYPGYDDAAKNMPLPVGRNRLAAAEILRIAKPPCLAGFSSDLVILQANSRNSAHDGPAGAFYETLKQGRVYRGYYAAAFDEVVGIYRDMAAGRLPQGDASADRPTPE